MKVNQSIYDKHNAGAEMPSHMKMFSRTDRWYFIADVIAVIAFAVVGMCSHHTLAIMHGLLVIFPYLIGCVAGYMVMWVRCASSFHAPVTISGTAIIIGFTVLIGMIVRIVVLPQDTSAQFIVVGGMFLVMFMLSWRGVYLLGRRIGKGSSAAR